MDTYSKRKYIITTIFLIVGVIFVLKLFWIQVLDSKYKQNATQNAVRREITYPARGFIYDRNGELLVYNKAAYDLLITPRETREFDTTELSNILQVDKVELVDAIKRARSYSKVKPSIVATQLAQSTYAPLQERLYKFPGFHVQGRTVRDYPRKMGAHVLGYVAEVDKGMIERDPYYIPGDFVGKTGIERAYESELRGIKGITFSLVDVHSQVKGRYEEGLMDTAAVIGNNLVSTLDGDLQEYAERLMQNKRGGVVAIEPSTGEVLVFVSQPAYDPNLLIGQSRRINYPLLEADTIRKPLYNRAITAQYPPGSTFKIISALVALQEGAITPGTSYRCAGKASSPIKCTHSHVSPLGLVEAIHQSCNSYFWNVFRACLGKYPSTRKGYEVWQSYVRSFGLGSRMGDVLFAQNSGLVPNNAFYDKWYEARWNEYTIRSLAIGQGEILITPYQMANVAAIVANRGSYIEPHLVRSIVKNQNEVKTLEYEKKYCKVDASHFEPVIDGMEAVIQKASSRPNSEIKDLVIYGKTGTIQNASKKDHSAYIAFSPRENPKIAIYTYIENGIWGATYARPISSLIIEKYLNDSIAPARKAKELEMMEANLLDQQ